MVNCPQLHAITSKNILRRVPSLLKAQYPKSAFLGSF